MSTQHTLGQKLKSFRKRIGLSQLDLENEIEASPGSISRIEAGKINPTKETLLKIARKLKLRHIELNSLLGILNFEPTPAEIAQVQADVKAYLESDAIAYLSDEYVNIWGISKGLKDQFELTDIEAEKLIGKNVLQLALDPNSIFGSVLDPEYLGRAAAIVLKRRQQDVDINANGFLQKLATSPLYYLVARTLTQIDQNNTYSGSDKQVHVIFKGEKLRLTYSTEIYLPNPRFAITEYINPEPYV